jgi:hypothetical protein
MRQYHDEEEFEFKKFVENALETNIDIAGLIEHARIIDNELLKRDLRLVNETTAKLNEILNQPEKEIKTENE